MLVYYRQTVRLERWCQLPVEDIGYLVEGFAVATIFFWFGRAAFSFYNVFH